MNASGQNFVRLPVVDDQFTIRLNRTEDNNTQLNISICDVEGRGVFKQEAKPGTNVIVNTQAFSKGMYFVTVASETKSEKYKIVK
ncbi:MAG TPA: T9SS type A sorting domain-containing protein [Chitinophagales bacterium]|nr:T9SS type A sorting domain-containing protein [Chitinophagales bacterium]